MSYSFENVYYMVTNTYDEDYLNLVYQIRWNRVLTYINSKGKESTESIYGETNLDLDYYSSQGLLNTITWDSLSNLQAIIIIESNTDIASIDAQLLANISGK